MFSSPMGVFFELISFLLNADSVMACTIRSENILPLSLDISNKMMKDNHEIAMSNESFYTILDLRLMVFLIREFFCSKFSSFAQSCQLHLMKLSISSADNVIVDDEQLS